MLIKSYFSVNLFALNIFLSSRQNIDFCLPVQSPQRGSSKEGHKLCVRPEIRKVINTSLNLNFTALRRSELHADCMPNFNPIMVKGYAAL